MTAKQFVRGFFLVTCFTILAIMGINYETDTSGVFNADFSGYRSEPNQRFVKMRYLLAHPRTYNAYAFGSSRVGNIDLTQIRNGYNYYNMTYSEGLPREWLDDIRMMLMHGVVIKQILLDIDEFSFRIDPATHEQEAYRMPYQEYNWNLYMHLLLRRPRFNPTVKAGGSIFDIYGHGQCKHADIDQRIENSVEEHNHDKKFLSPCNIQGNRIDATIEELAAIKQLTDEYGIELIVFIGPTHWITYRTTNRDEFNEFKWKLAQVVDYYDFSGINEVTTNNYYYYETSHYRPVAGQLILDRIFRGKTVSPQGFGVYVTKNNVESHIAFLQAQVKQQN